MADSDKKTDTSKLKLLVIDLGDGKTLTIEQKPGITEMWSLQTVQSKIIPDCFSSAKKAIPTAPNQIRPRMSF